MLVLARRIDEEIVIEGNIHLRVLGIKGQAVRIGITAPASVPVTRSELLRVAVSPSEASVQAAGAKEWPRSQGNGRPAASRLEEVDHERSSS